MKMSGIGRSNPEMLFGNNKRYNDFNSFLRKIFSERVQKISVDTGFTCPNRDGTKGIGGCTYCNNNTFTPEYTKNLSTITEQLNNGINFFLQRYKTKKFLAHFQSYTNTYSDINTLRKMYSEALSHPKVVGIVISTRPDSVNEEIGNMLVELAKKHFILLEFGVESTLNRTLAAINRCHTYEETVSAYNMMSDKGLFLGAHLILNLPGESREDIINHARELSKLPIHTLKLHHLQIVKHTKMALQYQSRPEDFNFMSASEYVDLVSEFVSRLRPDIVIERFINESPPHLVIAPKWNGVKKYEITEAIDKKLIEKDLWQGKNYLSAV